MCDRYFRLCEGRDIFWPSILASEGVVVSRMYLDQEGSRTCDFKSDLTPVTRLIFETKNRAIFLERFFGRGISGAALLPYNLVPINWLWSGFIFPELEHL